MAFSCRICRETFNLASILTELPSVSDSLSVVTTQCGHLFHKKCLEGALTNQKLLHATHGTGPLRRFCPVAKCNANIPSDNSVIKISFSDDNIIDVEGDIGPQDGDGKIFKRLQSVISEKEKLLENLEKTEGELEIFRSAFDQIKVDLSDIQSLMTDDSKMSKGDLIFWITKDGTYAPGKVLEIRRKPGENVHFAIVKLDNMTKVTGVGPHAMNRDTLFLPISEMVTFKSFFRDFFGKYQVAFDALKVDLNSEIQDLSSPTSTVSSADRSASYYRSTRKISRSISKSSLNSTLNPLDELDSISVESVPIVPITRKNSDVSPSGKGQRVTKITRSRTVHYGGSRPRVMDKSRSMSWVIPPNTESLDYPSKENPRNRYQSSEKKRHVSNTDMSSLHDEDESGSEDAFVREGERVIWYDTYSQFQQLGTVATVCEFTPCAIVNFDEHPQVKHKFRYRTVPLDELFPYDLASPEDKFRIAESYGNMKSFVDTHEHIFSISGRDSGSDEDDD